MRSTIDRLARLALLLSLGVAVAAGTSCRGDDGGETTTGGGSPAVAIDGEGMEPRIVIEHPVDAPGRPAGDRTAPALEPAPTANWVPHLAVTDLEASQAFYRDLDFTVSGGPEESAAEAITLSRGDVRLVLVAAPATDEEDTDSAAPEGGEDGDGAVGVDGASIVLHLVATDATDVRTVTDPDGHRLVLPEDR